jgi:CubicO group peptidase (beta-lactamase class C family)
MMAATAAASKIEDDLSTILQAIADENSQKYDCSIAIGTRAMIGGIKQAVQVAAGFSDMTPGSEVKAIPGDRYVWGSITKVVTGTALLRLHDQGLLPDLDAPVSSLVDPLLAKMRSNSSVPAMNFTKLSDLWGSETGAITIRHLATMQSGLPDFDTVWILMRW